MIDYLNNLDYLSFNFWIGWLSGFVVLILFIGILCFICCTFFELILSPVFNYYCKKHGYVKIEKVDGEVI